MNELMNKLLRLKPAAKALVTLAVVGLLAGGYYMLLYVDLSDEITQATAGHTALIADKAQYETRKREYVAYREELRKLQDEQRELLKALPKKAEIPQFMSNIEEQAALAGLEVVTLNMDAEEQQELYVKIPVRMEVRGGYHSLTRFFKNVSEIRRIVNIENLGMAIDTTVKADENAPPKLRAKFIAATFRYLDKPAAVGGGS